MGKENPDVFVSCFWIIGIFIKGFLEFSKFILGVISLKEIHIWRYISIKGRILTPLGVHLTLVGQRIFHIGL